MNTLQIVRGVSDMKWWRIREIGYGQSRWTRLHFLGKRNTFQITPKFIASLIDKLSRSGQ